MLYNNHIVIQYINHIVIFQKEGNFNYYYYRHMSIQNKTIKYLISMFYIDIKAGLYYTLDII